MGLEPLFSDAKWAVLKALSVRNMSPLELANLLNTTISNVSQQLRLLELAGLVSKVRVPNRDKGKPRMVYSLKGDCSYIISLGSDFAEKKLLSMTDYHKVVSKIWHMGKLEDHYYVEKLYWKLEDGNNINAFAVKLNGVSNEALVVLDGKPKQKVSLIKVGNHGGPVKTFKCSFFIKGEMGGKVMDGYHVIYDPQRLFGDKRGAS